MQGSCDAPHLRELDCHPRECGEPVITAVGVTLRRPGVLGRPVKPGDDCGECCALCASSLSIHNFKQPRFRVLAAQCVRALPVPLAKSARAMERREAPECLRGTL